MFIVSRLAYCTDIAPSSAPAKMNDLLTRMTPDEIQDGFWLVGVFERWGSMNQSEADEWRRRIIARQRFLDLDPSQSPS